MMKKLTFLLLLLIPSSSLTQTWDEARLGVMLMGGGMRTGNDFSTDTHCIAVYKIESGALVTDSKGSNTLTNHNTVTANTTYYKEGISSGQFTATSSQALYRLDGDLTSGFPLKTGDTTKTISICAWFRFATNDTAKRDIVTKFYGGTENKRSIRTSVTQTTSLLRLELGYNNGVSAEQIDHGTTLTVNTWYHMTATYKNSDKTYSLRIRDTSGEIVGTDLDSTATLVDTLFVGDAIFVVGAIGKNSLGYPDSEWFDGQIDEVVIFDDVITGAEATLISKGLYQ